MPSTATTAVQAAIQAAFSGDDGGSRARIGATLYASRFYAGIAALGTWAQIADITLGMTATPTGFSATFGISQVPTLDPANISVVFA